MGARHSSHAAQRLADAGAEIAVDTIRSRRWLFVVLAVVFGVGFPAVGIWTALGMGDSIAIAFGTGMTLFGVFLALKMISGFRKNTALVEQYDERPGV